MKVFWSWQSDTPGKIGRHFVREVLEECIQELKADLQIQDSERPKDELHLDHDRKDVPGIPDLARTILGKIDASKVFVADVTIVHKKLEGGRPFINPNVGIELGYALKAVGDQAILLVMNSAYGAIEELPFDLRHKAGPITFDLPPDATKAQISSCSGALKGQLKSALKAIISAIEPRPEKVPTKAHWLESAGRSATFVSNGQILLNKFKKDLVWRDEGPLMFLRLVPETLQLNLLPNQVDQLIDGHAAELPPFGRPNSWDHGHNKHGAVVYATTNHDPQTTINRLTQVSRNGEIWGIDSLSIAPPTQESEKRFPDFESIFSERLGQYINFSTRRIGLKPPFVVIAGMTGVQGYSMPGWITSRIPSLIGEVGSYGNCAVPDILFEDKIEKLPLEPRDFLKPFFEKVWGECGLDRPQRPPRRSNQ